MKKILFAIIMLASACAPLFAGPLDHFEITIAQSCTAGVTVTSVQVAAHDNLNALKTDYAGNVSVTASVGNVKLTATASNISAPFTGGLWIGDMVLYGAASPLTITVTEVGGTATGVTTTVVTAGPYAELLILAPGMVHAPGTVKGYTGNPVTQTTYQIFYVTVTACDKYYNKAASFAGSEAQSVYLEDPSFFIETAPASFDLTGGGRTAVLPVTNKPSPDVAQSYTLYAKDDQKTSANFSIPIYYRTLNDFFMWAEVNGAPYAATGTAVVAAGTYMDVTIKVSHDWGGTTINGFNEQVGMRAIYVTTTGQATLFTPIDINLTNGVGYASISYTARHEIKFQPYFKTAASRVTETADSIRVSISGTSPDSFTFTSDKDKLRRDETANLSVNIKDVYGNNVSGTAVNFAVGSGAGVLSAGTATTDYDGIAAITYTAPDANQDNVIYAYLTITAEVRTNTITINSTRLSTDPKVIKNYPNPFNPGSEETNIEYYLNDASKVKMKLYNVQGQLVWSKEIAKDENGGNKGGNTVTWDGKSLKGTVVGVGVYILKVKVEGAEEYTLTRKIAVTK